MKLSEEAFHKEKARDFKPVVAYGGPGFFGERLEKNENPIVEYGGPEFFRERSEESEENS